MAPLYPHHITQRGNGRQQTFFNDEDYLAYLELMSEWCRGMSRHGHTVLCQTIHLILVPEIKDGLNLAVGKAHKRYTRRIHFRWGWRDHLWQGRFASFVMDDNYLLSCTKYIELNPLRQDWLKDRKNGPFGRSLSSARAHIEGRDDILIKSKPMTDRISKPWGMFLSDDAGEHEMEFFRKHERTGRPMGEEAFIDKLECCLDRTLKPQKPGPKCRDSNN